MANALEKAKERSSAPARSKSTLSSPIRWIGGKGTNFQWILSHFPEHKTYVESFGGGASVLLNKDPSRVEIYNDLHADLVHLFEVLRCDRKSKVLQEKLRLTPFHEAEFRRAWREPLPGGNSVVGSIERARRIMVRMRLAFGGCGSRDQMPGFAFGKTINSSLAFKRKVDALLDVTERLRSVTIMSRDALDVIERFDTAETLHYCDPPYAPESRTGSRDYRHEMTTEDHERLAELLNRVQGKVILSGYDCDLYRRIYKGWRTDRREQLLQVAKEKTQKRVEVLWMNW
jgi:DNA adenine methylase